MVVEANREHISLLLEDATWLALCDSHDRDNDRVLACNGDKSRGEKDCRRPGILRIFKGLRGVEAQPEP